METRPITKEEIEALIKTNSQLVEQLTKSSEALIQMNLKIDGVSTLLRNGLTDKIIGSVKDCNTSLTDTIVSAMSEVTEEIHGRHNTSEDLLREIKDTLTFIKWTVAAVGGVSALVVIILEIIKFVTTKTL